MMHGKVEVQSAGFKMVLKKIRGPWPSMAYSFQETLVQFWDEFHPFFHGISLNSSLSCCAPVNQHGGLEESQSICLDHLLVPDHLCDAPKFPIFINIYTTHSKKLLHYTFPQHLSIYKSI